MFIIKFNKLIHNKVLWGAFAIVVALAFAGSDLLVGRRSADPEAGAGTLDGRLVSWSEYDQMRRLMFLERGGEPFDPDFDIEEEVWRRLAVLRTAEALGVTAADEEVLQLVVRDPAFRGPDGSFDRVRYEMILATELGISPAAYEELRRLQLMMAKAEGAVRAASWGVPSVAADQARGMTDRFTVRLIEIENPFPDQDMELTDEEIQAFFERNRDKYRFPDMVSVRYVSFPVSRFRDQVDVEEDDMRDFYDAHAERYRVTTNEVAELLPFDEVRGIVGGELRSQGARELAADAAADFADLFYLGVEGTRGPGAFERMADAQGLAVQTTGLFGADRALAGIDRDAPFVHAAFDLNPLSERDRYSDAVVGGEASYVLAFHERSDAHDPELAEVLDAVRADALEDARNRAFFDKVDRIRGTVSTEMAQGRALEEVLEELDLSAGSEMTLTAIEAFSRLPGGDALAMRMARMEPGEVSPAVFTDEGAVFLEVVSRQSGEEIQQRVMSSQMEMQMRNAFAEQILEDWRRSTLQSMKRITPRRTTALERNASESP